jgi:hypothetical protein
MPRNGCESSLEAKVGDSHLFAQIREYLRLDPSDLLPLNLFGRYRVYLHKKEYVVGKIADVPFNPTPLAHRTSLQDATDFIVLQGIWQRKFAVAFLGQDHMFAYHIGIWRIVHVGIGSWTIVFVYNEPIVTNLRHEDSHARGVKRLSQFVGGSVHGGGPHDDGQAYPF